MQRYLSWIRREVLPILAIVLFMTAGRSSLADHYHVPSGSMENTLFPGDRVIVDKTAYGLRIPYTKIDVVDRDMPAAGEIAVFDSPLDGELLIKRIVAVGGDQVTLHHGHLFINGEPLAVENEAAAEQFGQRVAELNLRDGGGPDIDGVTVPADMVLAMGDHRGNSLDGRYFGFVPVRELYGRAVAVYFRSGEGFVWRRL
ncbi:MAG: signal peptidase I [Gammaproteobacteria bacterium]|nr:signal peptidase I [Gammaproteobacteria bacterium]